MIDRVIDRLSSEYKVSKMCQLFEINQSGYYKRKKNSEGKRASENRQLRELIKDIFDDNKGRYGAPRIHAEVSEYFPCSRKRVAKLMREMGLKARSKKKFRHQKDAESETVPAENILNRDFTAECPNQKWAGDITYLWTTKGWHYLAIVMDLYNREIIGWAFGDSMESSLVCDAFFMAVCLRKPPKKCIFHSDRGSQYGSKTYKQLLEDNYFRQSMSRKGNCWDNACVESFFHTLKLEMIFNEPIRNPKDLKAALIWYINVYYNRNRRHSTLGNKTPLQFRMDGDRILKEAA